MSLTGIGGGDNTVTPLPFFRNGGDYDASVTYKPNTIVKYTDGIAYKLLSAVAVVGIVPTNTTYWEEFTEGGAGGSVAWGSITGKPTQFDANTLQTVNISATAPTSNQFLRYNSGTSAWTPTTYAPDWTDVANKPSTFVPAAHAHDAADVSTGIFASARIPDLDAAKITTGSLAIARGGTGLGAVGGANTIPGVNSAGTALEYKALVQGTGITIGHAANSITITSTNTGTVTSVGLSMPAIFSVGAAVTTSGNVSATLANQTTNLVFASPDGSTGTPAFRALTATDIPSLDAAKIGSGTLPVARGGTGNVTANAALNAFLPTQSAQAGKILSTDGTNTSWVAAGGAGTVTSVHASTASAPELTVTSSAITASGVITFGKANQLANYVWAGPSSGGATTPQFRALVAADLPSHSHVKADISDFAHNHDSVYYTKTELFTPSSGLFVDWTNLNNVPASFNASTLQTRAVDSVAAPTDGQVLTWNTAGNKWLAATPAGTGDMLKSVYDTLNNGKADFADSVDWSGVTNAPSTYAPTQFAIGLTGSTRLVSDRISDISESVEDIMGLALEATATIGINYDDSLHKFRPAVIATGLVTGSGLTVGSNLISVAYATALWNADKLQGVSISGTAPTTGQVLAYNGTSWIPSTATDPSPAFTSLTDGATINWNLNNLKSNNAQINTIGGNRALTMSNVVAGATGILIVKQDGTGGRTLSLPSGSKMVNTGAGAWTPTTGASKVDILSFVYDGTNYWWTVGKDYS